MFSVMCAGVYGFYEKRINNKRLITLYYFLTVGAIWTLVTSVMGFLMSAEDLIRGTMVNPYFFYWLPVIGFVMGIVFAFFPWLTGLRNSGDDTRKKS